MSLGSKHATSSGPDWKDVAEALESFQSMNGMEIDISVHLTTYMGTPALLFRGTVRTGEGVSVEPAVSVSVQLNNGSTSYRTMGAVLLNLLYQIDGQLAAIAWEGVEIK